MEFVITIKAEPEEMDTALQAVSRFFAQKFDEDDKKAMSGAERTRKWRENKRDESVTKCDDCDESVAKCDEQTSQKQEKDEKKSTKRKEEKEIYINNTSPDGEVQTEKVSTEKPKAKPEDDDFWKFAKENKELAKQFWLETGIFPVKKEFGRWVNDLRDLAEAGITVPEMQDAVIYMRSQNLPIGAPGSILKTARWLKANPQKATKTSSGKDRWDVAAEKIEAEMGNGTLWGYLGNENGEVVDI